MQQCGAPQAAPLAELLTVPLELIGIAVLEPASGRAVLLSTGARIDVFESVPAGPRDALLSFLPDEQEPDTPADGVGAPDGADVRHPGVRGRAGRLG